MILKISDEKIIPLYNASDPSFLIKSFKIYIAFTLLSVEAWTLTLIVSNGYPTITYAIPIINIDIKN